MPMRTPPPPRRWRLGCAGLLLLSLGVPAPAAAAESFPRALVAERVAVERYALVLHVAPGGDDRRGDGTARRPWATLPVALERAGRPASGRRVAVLVAAGRYLQPTLALKPGVDLFGGFAGDFARRDLWLHASILVSPEGSRILLGADDARVDGFHLREARVRGKGAALLCDGVSPVISNCVLADNRTLAPAGWNPPFLHETAHDGGAVFCGNGAAPLLTGNIFHDNATECGRGGAFAADGGAAPRLNGNVFTNNRAGLTDPMRSSDGGAVSFFGGARGELSGNAIVANEALTRNDAGGIFVALWSAPVIRGNRVVANEAGDDAGGLFLGGQEHRYDAPLDPFPPAAEFRILVEGNWFVANTNSARNSGAMRVTMETRARLADNVVAENAGGVYLQRSELELERNVIWQDWRFVEDKPSLGPSRLAGNVLRGPAGPVNARVRLVGNRAPADTPGGPHLPLPERFREDGLTGELTDLEFDRPRGVTRLRTAAPLPAEANLAGRIVRLSDQPGRGGQWRVIARAGDREMVVWGRLDAVTKAPRRFEVLRTFTPEPPDGGSAAPPR
jgi:hypothetical protein